MAPHLIMDPWASNGGKKYTHILWQMFGIFTVPWIRISVGVGMKMFPVFYTAKKNKWIQVSMKVIVTSHDVGLFHLFTGRIQPTYIGVTIYLHLFTQYQQDIPVESKSSPFANSSNMTRQDLQSVRSELNLARLALNMDTNDTMPFQRKSYRHQIGVLHFGSCSIPNHPCMALNCMCLKNIDHACV